MKSTTFSQLRNNAKVYFDAVEKGETVEVHRHSKLIALISPVIQGRKGGWGNHKPLKSKGLQLSKAIIAERKSRG